MNIPDVLLDWEITTNMYITATQALYFVPVGQYNGYIPAFTG